MCCRVQALAEEAGGRIELLLFEKHVSALHNSTATAENEDHARFDGCFNRRNRISSLHRDVRCLAREQKKQTTKSLSPVSISPSFLRRFKSVTECEHQRANSRNIHCCCSNHKKKKKKTWGTGIFTQTEGNGAMDSEFFFSFYLFILNFFFIISTSVIFDPDQFPYNVRGTSVIQRKRCNPTQTE